MFLAKMMESNLRLLEAAVQFHQAGYILPDTYIIDMDTLMINAEKILKQAKQQQIALYFMLKQVGRNPYIAQKLIELGYQGAVVVDFKEAALMMKHHIPIANVGHLVQPPKAMLQELVNYDCDYMTVFSYQKIWDINECAKKAGKVQSLLLKVIGKEDKVYSGQTAGFHMEELPALVERVKQLSHVVIKGVTAFPCFLYHETKAEILPTPNLQTLFDAKALLEDHGIHVININAPSTTSLATLQQMAAYPINSAEPGHGLTGSTPLHAHRPCEETPCVVYVSEISHNFEGKSYCYGGGHYRRSHMQHALITHDMNHVQHAEVIPPDLDSIDYYFGLQAECEINDTVLMAFRFQIFVTRSNVCLIEGLATHKPVIVKQYNSQGEQWYE